MDQSKVAEFLDRIGQIESAGGKYTAHKTLQSGMHKGQSAIGTYGLMPKTVDELANSSDDPRVKALKKMSDDQKREALAPGSELERALAMQLAEKVLERQGGDEEKAAYAWLFGHNLSSDEVEKRGYKDKDYVQKYSKLAGMMQNRTPASMPTEEALDLNAAQRAETLKALEQMKTESLFTPIESPEVMIELPKKAPAPMTPVEEEVKTAPIRVNAPPVAVNNRFGHINELVNSYKKIRK